jgi:D-alanine-D-alanine ligase-like ATP-grasp enzyme
VSATEQLTDAHAALMEAAARERGHPCDHVMLRNEPGKELKRWLRFRVGSRAFQYRRGVLRVETDPASDLRGPHVNGQARAVTKSKSLCKAFLAEVGVPTPRGAVFQAAEGAVAMAYFRLLGRPACIKPDAGRKGMNVHTGIATPEAFVKAYLDTAGRWRQIMVEEHLEGEVIRFYYVAPRAIAVKLSRPASVVGDGVHPIEALIAAKNEARAAFGKPGHEMLTIDDALSAHLASHGMSLAHVPAAGARVTLRRVSNNAAGADTVECADSTHASYARVVERACRAVPGLVHGAVDMMVGDRRVPARPGNHWVLEVNSSPGVLDFHHPWEGRPQDVCGAILDLLARAT